MARALTGLLLLTGLLAGCEKKNRDFCCTTVEACSREGGDGELHPCTDPDKPFCDNDGVYPESNGVGRTCIAPPGEPCGEGDTCADPATPICFDGLCVECLEPTDCPADRPVCGVTDHACGSCTEAEECSAFDDLPFCQSGGCVGCRTSDDCASASAPICDDDDLSCRGCQAGAECASLACDASGGACIDQSDVLYVEEGGDGTDCTRADPCGSIQDAVDLAAGDRIWILVAEGSYTETVTIAGKTVRILAPGADLSPAALQQPVLAVSGDADVRIEGLRLHDAGGAGDADDGLTCDTTGGVPTLTLVSVTIDGNGDKGIESAGCDLAVYRSTISGNSGGGLAIQNGGFDVINNFIVQNGEAAGLSGGVVLESTAAGSFLHNTVADNSVGDGQVGGIECNGTQTLRNNIIHGNDSLEVGGAGCSHEFSLIDQADVPGDGNLLQVDPTFVMAAEGDFHLQSGSAGVGVAEDSDVDVDFDGEVRPQGNGPDMGADEVVE